MEPESTLSRTDLLSCIEVGKTLTAQLDNDELFLEILRKVSDLLPAENWSLFLVDETSQELSLRLSVDLDPTLYRDVRLQPGEGVAGVTARDQRTLVVPDVTRCPCFSKRVDDRSGIPTRSLICIPLVYRGLTVGVLEVINPGDTGAKTREVLETIADYLAIAVQNARTVEQIRDMTVRDNLTGLYNTRFLHANLAQQIARYAGQGEPLSLLFMDVDNFKRVVDTYGHLSGSQVLREFAGTLRNNLEEPSYGVSYGGDEFVVVLPGYDRPRAVRKGEQILDEMRGTAYLAEEGHNIRICASIGVATCPDDAGTARDLLALADQTMFRIKGCGKNAVEAATDPGQTTR